MLRTDLTMVRGDTGVFSATLNDGTPAAIPVDDPGALYRMTVKRNPDDADPGIFSVTASQTSPGLAYLNVPPSATAGLSCPAFLYYDVQVTESGGRVSTVAIGRFTVVDDVSKGAP